MTMRKQDMANRSIDQLIAGSAETDSVTEMILVEDYDPETKTFVRVDGSIMVMFESEPWSAYDKPVDLHANLADRLAGTISKWGHSPSTVGAIFSSTIYPSKRIADYVEHYRAAGGTDVAILKMFEEGRIEFVKRHLTKPYFPEDAGWVFCTRLYRTIFRVVLPPPRPLAVGTGLGAWLHRAGRRLQQVLSRTPSDPMVSILTPAEVEFEAYRAEVSKEAATIARRLMNTMRSNQQRVRLMDSGDWLRTVRDLMWPDTGYRYQVVPAPGVPLYAQLPVGELLTDSTKGTVTSEEGKRIFRTATMRQHPESHHPGLTTMPQKEIDGAKILDYLESGWLTFTAKAEDRITMRALSSSRKSQAVMGLCLPGQRQTHINDSALAERQIDNEHRTYFWLHGIAVCHGRTDEEATDRLANLCDRLSELHCEFIRDGGRPGVSYCLQSLPGNEFPPVAGAERDVLVPDRLVIDLMPFFGHSRGGGSATCLMLNRAGEPFLVGPFGGSTNHGLLAAGSGKGKSVAAQFLCREAQRNPLARSVIVDNGNSFRAFALGFGKHGKHVNVLRSNLAFNPFYGSQADGSGFGLKVLLHLAYPSDSKETPTQASISLLEEVIRVCFEKKLTRGVPYQDLDELLRSHPSQILAAYGKRLTAAFPDETIQKAAEQYSEKEAQGTAILYRYRLIRKRVGAGFRDIKRLESLDTEDRQTLQNADFVLHFDEEEKSPYLLSRFLGRERSLERDGYEIELRDDWVYVQVADDDDVAALEGFGLKFGYTPKERERRRPALRAKLAAEYPTATAEALDHAVDQELASVSGSTLFAAADGLADFQDEVLLRDIGRRLEEIAAAGGDPAQPARDLVARLAPFHSGGTRARFFDQPHNLDLNANLITVLEIQDLTQELGGNTAAAVISTLIHLIQRWAMYPANRKYQKMIFYEEAWAYTDQYPVAGAAILASYRVGRKHNCANWIITQDLAAMAVSDLGKALLKLARNRWFLEQDRAAVSAVARVLEYSPMKEDLMASVRTAQGLMAEVFIDQPDTHVCEVGVLILDRPTYWWTTSAPSEAEFRDAIINEIMLRDRVDMEEATLRGLQQICERESAGRLDELRREVAARLEARRTRKELK